MYAIWLKTGLSRKNAMTYDSLLGAAGFIATLQRRQGLMVHVPKKLPIVRAGLALRQGKKWLLN